MKKIFLVAAVISCSQLFAQTDSSRTLDELIITANKYPNKTAFTGKVVTVITKQDLEKAGARNLSQLINEQGGVYLNGANSNPGKDKSIYLRGARVEHTLIAIDGIPVYDATGIGSNFDIRQIPIETVERVEILKGSQGTLYGSDAIAGVINIITKKPATNKTSADAMISYGSYNTFKGSAGLSSKMKKSDLTIGYNYQSTEGISESDSKTDLKNFDKDGFKQHGLYASFGLQPAEKIRLNPFLRFTNTTGDLDQDAFTDQDDFTYTLKNVQLGLRNEFGLGKGKLHQLYQFTGTKRNYENDSLDQTMFYEKYSESRFESNEHFSDIYLVYPFGKTTLTAGTDFRSSNTEQVSFYDYGFAKTRDTLKDAKHNQVSGYAAVNFVQNNFSIEAGGRFNHHSKYGGNTVFNINPSYLVNSMAKFFVNYSTGYRTPSLYQLYSIYGNKDLKPEESVNFEAGTQLFVSSNANIRITYFNRTVKNLMVFYTSPAFEFYYINRDKQEDHGIELDSKFSIADKLNLKLFYSYADGEVHTKNGAKDTSFYNLYRRPKHSAAISLGSNLAKHLYASLQVNYNGETKDMSFDMTSFTQQEVTLKAYTLVSLYTEYSLRAGKLKLFADLRNLLDTKYQEVYGYRTPGFNAYGGVRFKL